MCPLIALNRIRARLMLLVCLCVCNQAFLTATLSQKCSCESHQAEELPFHTSSPLSVDCLFTCNGMQGHKSHFFSFLMMSRGAKQQSTTQGGYRLGSYEPLPSRGSGMFVPGDAEKWGKWRVRWIYVPTHLPTQSLELTHFMAAIKTRHCPQFPMKEA